MKLYRKEQLSSLIQKKLGELIIRHIEFPPGSLTTISEVEVSEDFKKAIIWVSVIPGEASERALKILTRGRGLLQYHLGEEVRVRVMPRIEFALDKGAEQAALIEKISLGESDSP